MARRRRFPLMWLWRHSGYSRPWWTRIRWTWRWWWADQRHGGIWR